MEGSGSGRNKPVDHAAPKIFFERAGLPVKSAAAWQKAGLRVTGNFKRDVAAGTNYWRVGTDLLAKLPEKPKRTAEQKLAAEHILLDCRRAREDFLRRHAETVYRKLTKNLANFIRVDDLVYDAAKLVPGLTPTHKHVNAESALMQSEKDGSAALRLQLR